MLAVTFLVVLNALVDVLVPPSQHAVDQDGELMSHGRNCFWRAELTPEAAELGAELAAADAPWDLLVNATPVGLEPQVNATPLAAELLNPAGTVFDTVYRPLETRLLREARARGCRTQDGLDMLVHQAVEQIRLWSGRTPSAARLRRAALAALAQK